MICELKLLRQLFFCGEVRVDTEALLDVVDEALARGGPAHDAVAIFAQRGEGAMRRVVSQRAGLIPTRERIQDLGLSARLVVSEAHAIDIITLPTIADEPPGGGPVLIERRRVLGDRSRVQDVYINGTGTPLAGQVLRSDGR